jgi:hypothetical protein
MNDQDAVTISSLTGSAGVEESVPGDAVDGNLDTDFTSTVEDGTAFWNASLEKFVTVDAVRVRTSNIFSEAIKLQSA